MGSCRRPARSSESALSKLGHAKALLNHRANAKFDRVDGIVSRVVVSDRHNAVRIAGSDLLVGGVDAGVEIVGLALEAVLVATLSLALLVGGSVPVVTLAGAGKRGFERRKQQDGQVGLEVVADGGVHGEDALGAKLAAGSLVGLGGGGEIGRRSRR